MLKLHELEDMEPYTIFASGITIDNASGINMANSDEKLKWVACRGQIHDWCIYCLVDDSCEVFSDGYVHDYGEKITSEHNIKKLVPCEDDAFDMYRY